MVTRRRGSHRRGPRRTSKAGGGKWEKINGKWTKKSPAATAFVRRLSNKKPGPAPAATMRISPFKGTNIAPAKFSIAPRSAIAANLIQTPQPANISNPINLADKFSSITLQLIAGANHVNPQKGLAMADINILKLLKEKGLSFYDLMSSSAQANENFSSIMADITMNKTFAYLQSVYPNQPGFEDARTVKETEAITLDEYFVGLAMQQMIISSHFETQKMIAMTDVNILKDLAKMGLTSEMIMNESESKALDKKCEDIIENFIAGKINKNIKKVYPVEASSNPEYMEDE